MYLDIPANANLDEPVLATFKADGPPQPVRELRLWRNDSWMWCAVTGWAEAGAVPAYIQMIEESGDGPARLVHGGAFGLRLGEGVVTRWSTDDATQWGEPFLIVTPDAQWR